MGSDDKPERKSRRTSELSTTGTFDNDERRHSHDQSPSRDGLNEPRHIPLPSTPSTTQASPRRGRSGSLFDEVADMGMKQTRRLSASPTRKSRGDVQSSDEFSSDEDEDRVSLRCRTSTSRSGLYTPRSPSCAPNRGFESVRRRRQQKPADLLFPQIDSEARESANPEEYLDEQGNKARNRMASTVRNFKDSRLSLDRSAEMSRRVSLDASRRNSQVLQDGLSSTNSDASTPRKSEARKTDLAQSSPLTPLQQEFERVLAANPGTMNASVVATYERNRRAAEVDSSKPSWITNELMRAYIREPGICISPSSPDFLSRPHQPRPASPRQLRQRSPGEHPGDRIVRQRDDNGHLYVEYLEDETGTRWDLDGKEQSEEEE